MELRGAPRDQSTSDRAPPADNCTTETTTMNAMRTAVAATAQVPQEGRQYLRLTTPQPVETGKKIEVLEFFSYGCPHCGDFEPMLQAWLKTAPADVQFRRVPVMFQDRWVPLGKEYYTLEALGEDARLSPLLFTAIHK